VSPKRAQSLHLSFWWPRCGWCIRRSEPAPVQFPLKLSSSPVASDLVCGRRARRLPFLDRCITSRCTVMGGVQTHLLLGKVAVHFCSPSPARSRNPRHNKGSSCTRMSYFRIRPRSRSDRVLGPNSTCGRAFQCKHPESRGLIESYEIKLHLECS